jgi:hypothetical protein
MAKYSLRRINEISAQAVAHINDLIEIYQDMGKTQLVGELLGYKEGLIGTFALADQKLRYAAAADRARIEDETAEGALGVFSLLIPQMEHYLHEARMTA